MPNAVASRIASLGPSFDEIVTHFAPTEHRILSWVEKLREFYVRCAKRCDLPLRLEQLLRFGYEVGTPTGEGDEPFEDVEAFVAVAHEWAIAEWLRRAEPILPLSERVAAALELSSSWWLPVLQSLDAPGADAVERLVRAAGECARDPEASRAVLETALATKVGLPPSRPPPLYVGHFSGAVWSWLEALVDPPNFEKLARALDYAAVGPDGFRHEGEIASAVELPVQLGTA
jgi:hypothetical protein